MTATPPDVALIYRAGQCVVSRTRAWLTFPTSGEMVDLPVMDMDGEADLDADGWTASVSGWVSPTVPEQAMELAGQWLTVVVETLMPSGQWRPRQVFGGRLIVTKRTGAGAWWIEAATPDYLLTRALHVRPRRVTGSAIAVVDYHCTEVLGMPLAVEGVTDMPLSTRVYPAGDEGGPMKAVKEAAQALGAWFGCGPTGQPFLRPLPSLASPTTETLQQGEALGVATWATDEADRASVVVVVNRDREGLIGWDADLDSTSRTYVGDSAAEYLTQMNYGRRPGYGAVYAKPLDLPVPDAMGATYAARAERMRLQGSASSFSMLWNPWRWPGDVLVARFADGSASRHLVTSMRLPITAGGLIQPDTRQAA